jgi:ABC-2 type transport system permease protein
VQLTTFAAAGVMVAAGTALGALAGGVRAPTAAWFALGTVASAWAFTALSAAVCQFTRSRRRAVGVVGSVLGACYLVRALGDGSPGRGWLTWCTPLGWVERLRPFGPAHPIAPILALVAWIGVGVGVAARYRGHRDSGDSVLTAGTGRRSRRAVRSVGRLDLLLHRGSFFGWTIGTALTGLLFGFIAADIAKFVAENPSVGDRTRSITGRSLASVRGFLGLSFAVIAVVGALFAGAQLLAARRQEESTALDNLLTSGAPRGRWLAVRLLDAAAALCLMALVAGVAAWAGVRLSGQRLAVVDSVRGALNTLPVSMLFLGMAALTYGRTPRMLPAEVYGTVTLGYALLMVAAFSKAPRWLIDLSPFSHLAPVPAAHFNATSAIVLLALGCAGVAGGAWCFERRDILGE